LRQVTKAFNLAQVSLQNCYTRTRLVVKAQFFWVPDQQVQLVISFLNQRFSDVVTNTATGTRQKNPLGGHGSVQIAGIGMGNYA
jgi:hypothetical protein